MAYSTIHTTYGLSRMAAAEATGVPINLTHMAVGDGNGNPTTPSPTQTTLVRETYRSTINRVFQNPDRPTQYTAELVVPLTAGGFTLRELAVFDDAGGMFVVGNLPDAYLPSEGEGAFADAVIRCVFEVSNASVVNVFIDPNIAVASQTWVLNNVTAATVIPGGLTSQVLKKVTNADGDYEWGDPDVTDVVVDVIEEKQTLAALQTQVDLVTTTTNGLAVYIEGVRISRGAGIDDWDANPSDTFTSIILGKSYPADTKITLVQNDPLGSAIQALEKNQNLADVPNAATARTNLDVFSKAETRQMAPAGMVAYFASPLAPAGWLKANGATISRTAYAALFAAIGTTYGAGDGTSTFRLPDLRGEFLRGWDDGRGIDGGRALGSYQAGQNASHDHGASSGTAGSHTHTGVASEAGTHSHSATSGEAGAHTHSAPSSPGIGQGASGGSGVQQASGTHTTSSAGVHSHPISVANAGSHIHSLSINASGSHSHAVFVSASGGSEARPRNIAMLACIKF